MKQNISKINVATHDYRGRKSILTERVIEGVSTNYNLTNSNLQLSDSTPKVVIIDSINNGKVYLPNAQTLLPGWKIQIINNSLETDCEIYYYDSGNLFTTVAKNKMTEIIFLGIENENDYTGNWKVVILSEQVVNDTDIYTTNLYTTTDVSYSDLGSGFAYNAILAKISKNKILQSIYIRNKNNFVGANVKLDIGIPSNTKYFYEGIDLTSNVNIRNLYNEILNINNNEYIIGNFYIDNAISNTWNVITPSETISTDIRNSCYGNGLYVFQDGTNIYNTDSLSSNIQFNKVSINAMSYNAYSSISNYSLQYINNRFYFFGITNIDGNRLCYSSSSDAMDWTTEVNRDIEIDSIDYITHNNNHTYIICKKDNNSYIIYIDDITNIATWSLYEVKYNDTFISNIHNIAYDGNNVVINAESASYYSTDNGQTWNIVEQYSNSEIYKYKYKYLNNIWIRFQYNTSNNAIKYIDEFNIDINSWESKTLVGASSNIDYILDINYTNNLWSIFRLYNASDADHFDIITSTNFFTTLVEANPNFGTDNILSICGDNNGYLLTGENGKLSYMNGNSSFIGLSAGDIEFVVEYSSDINPVNLLNPIIQGQIMPLGTIIHYPFGNSLPGGYARLDGHIETNARNKYPEFCKLLDNNNGIMVYNNYSDYETAYINNNGNVPKFAWVNSTDLRFPSINCFIRGFTGDTQNVDYVSFYSDGLPNITGYFSNIRSSNGQNTTTSNALYNNNTTTYPNDVVSKTDRTYYEGIRLDASRSNSIYGKYSVVSDVTLQNKVIPAHIAYPYIMAIYHIAQEIGTYNLQTLGEELDRLNAQIAIAQSEINDMTNKIPVATILAYSGNTLPSDNSWMWCDGSGLLSTNYPKLYEKINTIYGSGDGVNTDFNIPNLSNSKIPIGESTNYTIGTTGGEFEHTLTINEMPSHNHSLRYGAYGAGGGGSGPNASTSGDIYTSYTGGDQAHNNMQPYSVIKGYIIKVR